MSAGSARGTPSVTAAPRGTAARPRRGLRRRLLGNLWITLAGSLGVMQALIVQWVAVVAFGGEGMGLFTLLVVAALLAALNLYTVPVLRGARMRGGGARLAARWYMTGGIATLLVGLSVVFSFLGLAPIAAVASLLGVSGEHSSTLFRLASVGLVGSVVGMIAWGFTGGQRRVVRTRVAIPLAGLHPDHRGLEIAHITDLHIGNGMEGERLAALVRDTNDVDADLIVLTGDLFDFDPGFVEEGARGLSGLRARLGVYAVLGNHDTYTGTELVVDALRRNAPNIRLLRGECVRLPLDEPLYIAGVEDPGRNWTDADLHVEDLERLAEERPSDGPVLLLVHRPQAFPQAARLGFPLVLAGHTHGGQMALPLPGGKVNLARIVTRFHRGLYELEGSVMYVNRGVGVAGPAIRFNCSREIATVELA